MASKEGALDFRQMTETLSDERCGLYFLAGVDVKGAAASGGTVTIHAAQGALDLSHQYFIESRFAELHPDFEVRLRFHSNDDLNAPESLEGFARCFRHDHIVADPTGAFDRVSHLLELSRRIRAELGESIDRILWQADASALVALAAPSVANGSGPEERERFDRLCDEVNLLVENRAAPDLKKAIRSVHVSRMVPSGRYTPIDGASLLAPAGKNRLYGLSAYISGIAALIGLGTISVASANTPAVVDEDQLSMPGIAGLVGLTTLGENSYGLRNRYQAIGGLRLYFGETGVPMAPALVPNPVCADDCRPFHDNEIDGPEWPEPSRVAYGT